MSALPRPDARPAASVDRPAGRVDPRGQRFAATLTSVVLAVVLVTIGTTFSTVLIAIQLAIFAVGVALGPARTPYARLFATVVRPRIGAPAQTEDARPPRFAQAVGGTFALVALVALLAGVVPVAAVAVGFALAAALLNAATGFCLGCEMYLIVRRVAPQRA